jgi:penicillin-binding protein 1A
MILRVINYGGDIVKKTKKKSSWLKKILSALIIAFILLCSLGVGVAVPLMLKLPELDSTGLANGSVTTSILDQNNDEITHLHGEMNRIPVSLKQISPHVIDALLAVEDRRFYQHNGLDLYRIAGALWADLKSRSFSQGGSTITQQLVGVVKLDRNQKTLQRKIQEALLAFKVEREYSKGQILEMYLNRVYFGEGAYGIEAASRTFFGKHASDLNVQESALLVGIIQNPYRHSPILHPDAARNRRNVVLGCMVDYKKLSVESAAVLKKTPVMVSKEGLSKSTYHYQYYIDYVMEQAVDDLGLKGTETSKLFTDGYKIYTSLDQNIQKRMEEIYANPQNSLKAMARSSCNLPWLS